MDAEELESLVSRYWAAEAATRSALRAERMRVASWDGDLSRVDEEVQDVLRDPDQGDRFILAAAESDERPDEDRVVVWLGGSTVEDAISAGDTGMLERLVEKGLDAALARRIAEFID